MFDIWQDLTLCQQTIFMRTNITTALILWMALAVSFCRRKTNHMGDILKGVGVCLVLCLFWFFISCALIKLNDFFILSVMLTISGVGLTFLGIRKMEDYLDVARKNHKKNRK